MMGIPGVNLDEESPLVGASLVVFPKGEVVRTHQVRRFLYMGADLSMSTLVCTDAHSAAPGMPRAIPEFFDSERVKAWMAMCQYADSHKETCNGDAKTGVGLAGFQLIDCEDLVVRDAGENVSWVALSYVWAIAKDNQQNPAAYHHISPAGRRLPDRLPAVVLDAVHVAKSLGYRFIWIDRYCIDQTDPTHVKQQIAIMDRIYRGADLTIVSASSQNGLPGVNLTRRRPQSVVQLPGQNGLALLEISSLVKAMHPDVCPWTTRGWTCQEDALSRRKLFFTDREVYFRCRGDLACWEGFHELDQSRSRIGGRPYDYGPHHPEGGDDSIAESEAETDHVHDTIQNFWERASEFSDRSLTHSADTFDAFQGIAKTYESGQSFDWLSFPAKVPLYIFHGLPSLCPPMALQASHPHNPTLLIMGLCWSLTHSRASERDEGHIQAGIPSWSWLGWKGSKYIGWDFSTQFFCFSTVRKMENTSSAGSRLAPLASSTVSIPTIDMQLDQPYIGLEATLIRPSSFSCDENDWTHFKLSRLSYADDGDVDGPFTANISSHDFLAELRSGSLAAVLMGGQCEELWEDDLGSVTSDSPQSPTPQAGLRLQLYVLVLKIIGRSLEGRHAMARKDLLRFSLDLKEDEERLWPHGVLSGFGIQDFNEEIYLV